ncbi:MAG: L-aspartate oxidase [Deltaproteobacteria bacterium]|nr:L-aspartate oxidase [Deltaproteobacteria bacterium]
MSQQTDFLILGSGIAGLSYALEVADFGRVLILTKKDSAESNTNYAQGGIASVWDPEDSFSAHIQDTLIAGAGLCDEKIVRMVVEEGPERVKHLIDLGVQFSKKEKDKIDLGKEGGHSARRILHQGDITGKEIERALLERVKAHPHITILEHHVAIDLITTKKLIPASQKNQVIGAYALNRLTGEVITLSCKTCLLATGGAGKVYLYTSNPDIATGDGIAMAWRAGATVSNLEFVQFHPTCLFHPQAKSFLISEALRGEGAILRTQKGDRFMTRYHPQAELAPRDIVARAIDAELKKGGEDFVYLDISHQNADFLKKRFPSIYERCLSFGFDLTKGPIPVVPAAHYFCGGVQTNEYAQTEVKGLYACGEVACTGLHGANRLASNSLLEAVVFAKRAATDSVRYAQEIDLPPSSLLPIWNSGQATDSDEAVVITQNWDEIRRTLWNYVGIVRSTKRLLRAQSRIEFLREEVREYYWNFKITADLIELRNLVLVAELVVRCALQRQESRGLHYTLDYPDFSDRTQNSLIKQESILPD